MRQIITDYGDLGHPFNIQDYGHMQQGFQEVVNAIMQSLATNPTDIIILTGCSVTTNTTNTFTTAGWIYYNGQIIQVNAHNIVGTNVSALNWYLDITGFDPLYVTYGDGSQKQVHSIPVLKMTYGSGNFANSSLVSYNVKNAFVAQQYGSTPDSNGFYSPNTFTNPGFYKIDYSATNRNGIPNPYTSEWPNLNNYLVLPNSNVIVKYYGNIKVTQTDFTTNGNFNFPSYFTTAISTLEQELCIFSLIYSDFYFPSVFQIDPLVSYGHGQQDPVSVLNSDSPVSPNSYTYLVPLTLKRYYIPFTETSDYVYNEDFSMLWTDWRKIY